LNAPRTKARSDCGADASAQAATVPDSEDSCEQSLARKGQKAEGCQGENKREDEI
jgi:hypothetical protein